MKHHDGTPTKVCRKCGDKKPAEDFPVNPQASESRSSVCPDCWGGQGYVDEDAKASTPPMSSKRLIRIHGLTVRELLVAKEASKRAAAYLTWGGGGSWDERTAEDVVDGHMEGESERRKARVLAVALRLADEEMGDAREDAA